MFIKFDLSDAQFKDLCIIKKKLGDDYKNMSIDVFARLLLVHKIDEMIFNGK